MIRGKYRVARHLSRHATVAWLLLLAAPLGVGCSTAMETAPAVRLSAGEVAISRSAYEALLDKFPAYDNPALQRYVQTVGARLVAAAPMTNFQLRFTVLDTPGVFAYSFAHGEIVIARGLLMHLNSEAQLAAVLAHEVGHVVSLHPLRQMQESLRMRALEEKLSSRLSSQQGRDTLSTFGLARIRAYSREHETEADMWSERLLARAGYDPRAMAQVLRFFMQENAFWDKEGFELWEIPDQDGGEGVFATHPRPDERLQMAIKRQGQDTRVTPATDTVYLSMLNGSVYGLSERFGVWRGNVYSNPSWRMSLTLPPDWYVFTTDNRVVMAPRGRDGLLMMWMKKISEGETRRQALERLARNATIDSFASRAGTGLIGETAVARLRENQEDRSMRVAVYDIGAWRLHVVGFTFAPRHWNETDKQFRVLLDGLRTLSPSEVQRVQPWRLRIVRTGPEATFTPSPSSFSVRSIQHWELLNQVYPNGRLLPGQWAKTVE